MKKLLSLRRSPINQRRLANFKANRRGYYSFWLFLFLFTLSLFAEFLMNDKPLLIRYEGEWYFPLFNTYAETTFDGDFETEADYHSAFIQEKIKEKGNLWWPLIPYSYDTIITSIGRPVPSAPDEKNWLGTDDQARDVLARVVYGFRTSVFFGLLLTAISIVVGLTAGAAQGYFGGLLDLFFQRFMEIWDSIPTLYLLIILSSVFTPSFGWLLLLMSLFGWMSYVGVVRAEFLRARNFDYVRAARALGVPELKIMFRHVLPNAVVATITFLPFNLSGAIGTLAALDFLGFGLPPPSASLGELIYQGMKNLQAPWLGLTGFFALAVMLSLLIFIGEALRDALDPRKVY